MSDADGMAETSQALTDRIAPMLRGQHPSVVSAVLADLTAMWIAGHRMREGTPADTEKMQRALLDQHVQLIRDLIPVNVRMLDERVANGEIGPDDVRLL